MSVVPDKMKPWALTRLELAETEVSGEEMGKETLTSEILDQVKAIRECWSVQTHLSCSWDTRCTPLWRWEGGRGEREQQPERQEGHNTRWRE